MKHQIMTGDQRWMTEDCDSRNGMTLVHALMGWHIGWARFSVLRSVKAYDQ